MFKKRTIATAIIIFLITVLTLTSNCISSFILDSLNLPVKGYTSETKYNYAEVLQKSIYFYEAQRSGKLPANNRVEWRGDSGLKDGSDRGIDLTGGWYDAGDHMKFGFPMASSTTLLAWGVMEYEDAYKKSGQYNSMLDNLRWVNNYFIKAHPSPTVLWGQVGKGSLDHAWWGPAEVMQMERPAYKIDASCPGSDLAGETAAAMAASSIVFKKTDPNYSSTLLRHAKELYEFADRYRGKYSDCITDANEFYKSSGYNDELVWGATWLYQATGDKKYLDKAEQDYDNLTENPNDLKPYNWTHTWDDKSYGSYVVLSKLTGKKKYIQDAERWLNYWCDRCKWERILYTNGGLAWLNEWGSLRYASKTAFLAFIYSDWVKTPSKKARYQEFAEKQINYILGSNPQQRSYVVGFGNNPPNQPHHRTAHGSWANSKTLPEKSRHILYGALVGGPGKNDDYKDERSNFMMTEVATDYNAGFTGAIAKLYGKYGGQPLPDFPQPAKRDDEFFVESQANRSGDKSTEIRVVLHNQSAWPARIVKNISFRYFVDASEVVKAGRNPSDIQVKLNDKQGAAISNLKVLDKAKNIYYVQVDMDGSQIYPGGEEHYKKEVKFSLTNSTSAWNLENDWSYQEMKNQGNLVKNVNIPIYDSGKLIFGAEPGKSSN
jgi:endoglucanase